MGIIYLIFFQLSHFSITGGLRQKPGDPDWWAPSCCESYPGELPRLSEKCPDYWMSLMDDHWMIWWKFDDFHDSQSGWWYNYPSEKWWSESQLGWSNSQLNGKIKFMFQTTNQQHMIPNELVLVNPCCTAWWMLFSAKPLPSLSRWPPVVDITCAVRQARSMVILVAPLCVLRKKGWP